MKAYFVFFIILISVSFSNIYSQIDSSDNSSNELSPSDTEILILFLVAILLIIGVSIYISREIIRRKKTDYDKSKFESQKNRDFEKYHSDWTEDVSSESESKKIEEEFREAIEDSSLPNYYNILGVSKNATSEQIKRKYRELAKELHPDKSDKLDSKDKMAEINKAYEVLSNEENRKKYDRFLNLS